MTSIIKRFEEIRSEENGFTTIEALVTMLLVGILAAMTIGIMVTSLGLFKAYAESEESVNQGVVADKVTELYKAAERYRQDFPDRPITKKALTDGGYIVMPASYTWTVGTYGLNSKELCALAYSTADQTDKYTAEDPAEYATYYELKSHGASGCWKRDENKQSVPDWNQERAFPQGVWYGTNS